MALARPWFPFSMDTGNFDMSLLSPFVFGLLIFGVYTIPAQPPLSSQTVHLEQEVARLGGIHTIHMADCRIHSG